MSREEYDNRTGGGTMPPHHRTQPALHLPRHYLRDELFWFVDHETATMRLPRNDISLAFFLYLCEYTVQSNRKRQGHSTSLTLHRRVFLGGIFFVGVIVVIMLHKVARVQFGRLARSKLASTRGADSRAGTGGTGTGERFLRHGQSLCGRLRGEPTKTFV